jgi:hypothetical protein
MSGVVAFGVGAHGELMIVAASTLQPALQSDEHHGFAEISLGR